MLLSVLMHILFISTKAGDHMEPIITDRGQAACVRSQDLSLNQREHKAHPQAIPHSESCLFDWLIKTYTWMMLSTPKLQVTSMGVEDQTFRARSTKE